MTKRISTLHHSRAVDPKRQRERTTVSLSENMADAIDQELIALPGQYANRSEWVHEAIREKFRRDRRHE